MSAARIIALIEEERANQLNFRGWQEKDPTKEALARYAQEQAAKRGDRPPPAGGLFDECTRAQRDLF